MRIKLCIGLCATAFAAIVTTSVLSSREGLAAPPHEATRAAMVSESASLAGSAGARNQTARLVASDGETEVASSGGASEAVAPNGGQSW